jgi:hypothetical protein
VEKVAGTENTESREVGEEAGFWTPGMQFSLLRVEKVAGTENTDVMS